MQAESVALALFLCSLLGVLTSTILLPLLGMARASLAPRSVEKRRHRPTVTILIPAHNEEKVICEKISNCLAINYPLQLMQILIASNGSDDLTVPLAQMFEGVDPKVDVLELETAGKSQALNRAFQDIESEIVVFTDADSLLDRNSIAYMVDNFHDSAVGAVAGDCRCRRNPDRETSECVFLNYDRWLGRVLSRSGNATSATGQLFALRRSLLHEVPQGVTDDFFLSTSAPLNSRRLVFEPLAVAYGPILDPRGEYRRKLRLITRSLRSVWERRALLNPSRYGFYSLQLWLHKVLRRLLFVPLTGLLLSTTYLAPTNEFFFYVTVGIWCFVAMGVVGCLFPGLVPRLPGLGIPAYLLRWNWAALTAVLNLLRRRKIDSREAQRTTGIKTEKQPDKETQHD